MDEVHPPHHQLLELIPNWPNQETNSEEKQLELRLGPPGDHENWTSKNGSTTKNSTSHREKDKSSLLSLGYFTPSAPSKTLHQPDIWINENQTHKFSSLLDMNTQVLGGNNYHQSLPLLRERESLHEQQQHQACGRSGKVVDLQKNTELKKAFSIASANDTAVTNSYDQKRSAAAPVVGWPPIRSFRKNLATSSSSRLPTEAPNVVLRKDAASEKRRENCHKGLFVKINMDGVPIGRKVDLKACESYEKLSCAVDELFRGLLAAQTQKDPSVGGRIQNDKEGADKAIMGILGGSGEYTLVYEDIEGDRMLVGDVPWHMFISTVKRLRVLKTSELSSSLLVGSKARKQPN